MAPRPNTSVRLGAVSAAVHDPRHRSGGLPKDLSWQRHGCRGARLYAGEPALIHRPPQRKGEEGVHYQEKKRI